ncbi:MAG: TM2 domain-containing protein [Flavisolibacter sp.]
MEQMFTMLQGLQPDELILLKNLVKDFNEQQKQQFFSLYQGKRKDPNTLLIFTLVGFFGVAGIQRFVVGETGLGLVYLFTGGFCGIGTIVDVINNKKLSSAFNQKQAFEAASMVKLISD